MASFKLNFQEHSATTISSSPYNLVFSRVLAPTDHSNHPSIHYMKSLLIASALMLFSLFRAEASVTIFLNNTSLESLVLVNSAGADLDASYRFALGAFEAGFTADSSNINDWASNWNTLTVGTNGNGWNPTTKMVNLSGVVGPANVADFPQGTQLYLWVYNAATIETATEWAVVTTTDPFKDTQQGPPWLVPDVNGGNGDPDLFLADADTPLYGGVNDLSSTNGTRTATPSDFQIQTHAVVVAPVPEPGSCLLVGFAGLALRLRRRRAS
jgi:hypothetical protein